MTMREILFRGKRIDNGEWVEGYYVKANCGTVESVILPMTVFADENIYLRLEFDEWHEVATNTVGQYTGLTANGKKIFEGDIIELEYAAGLTELWVFDFGNCGGVQNVTHDVGYMGFYLRPLSDRAIKAWGYGQRDDPIYYLNALRLHIAGNIYDNPELLKGEDLRT